MTSFTKNKVVVAMSGGVDSSVAALLLKQQGMEVIGVSMKTHETTEEELQRGKTCCTSVDIMDARRVCQHLDIPFYAMDYVEEFEREVIQYFSNDYIQGRTPNPCVACNSKLKFASLLKKTQDLGAYYLATGHYAEKTRDKRGKFHVMKSQDLEKDQTYFLFGLGQRELEHILFPLAGYQKEQVRELARKAGLKTADKAESQEICFVPNNDYAAFLEKKFPDLAYKTGKFITDTGEVIADHEGIHAYTVGQRRGLGVALGERTYVTEIRPQTQEIVLGTKEDLLKKGLWAKDLKWVNPENVTSASRVTVKLRHRHQGVGAMLDIKPQGVKVDFLEPAGAVTPGQAAVFYDGNEMLGGGFIESSF